MTQHRMYINGSFVESSGGAWLPVIDPSSEEVIAEVPAGNAQDIDSAVTAARSAFDSGPWSHSTAQERGRLLFQLANRIRENASLLAELECRNTGKPIVEAEFDIADTATCFEYYGACPPRFSVT